MQIPNELIPTVDPRVSQLTQRSKTLMGNAISTFGDLAPAQPCQTRTTTYIGKYQLRELTDLPATFPVLSLVLKVVATGLPRIMRLVLEDRTVTTAFYSSDMRG